VNRALFYKHIIKIVLIVAFPLPAIAGNPAINGSCQSSTVERAPSAPIGNKTIIQADDSNTKNNTFTLNGNVKIQDQNQSLQADHINYNQASGKAELNGNIKITNKELTLTASQGQANTKKQTALFNNVEFELNRNAARGKAASAELKSNNKATFNKISYTTCKKSREDWLLKAKKITLDQNEEVGYASDVRLKFKGIPLFYFPKLSFPIGDKRKTGFLTPSFGNSTRSGSESNVPWYWNIAPDRDATLNLRYMSDRGAQLGAEYRHLHKTAASLLRLEYLNDDAFNDDRHLISVQHDRHYLGNWKARADLNRVSDQQYFNDLGDGLNLSNVTHLTRVLETRQDNLNGYFFARAHEFQAINTSNSYQRLPQLGLNLAASSHHNQIHYSLQSELTQFDHRDNVITGTRFDILPGIGYDLSHTAYYLRPKLMMRHTRYQLENTGIGQSDNITRNIPIASLDTGLFFERPLTFAGGKHTITLEPRLYYLYAKHEDQSNIPVFDTSLPDFRFADLFRHNQFTGPDRQSNANEITLAASSRLIDTKDGNEWLRLSIGQTFYFDDKRVGLPGQTLTTDSSSDFVGELEARINQQSQLRISGLWDTAQNQANRGIFSYRYYKDNKHRMGLDYRYQRNLFEQTDLKGRWKLSPKWHALARWTYSLRDNQTIDSLAGLEYETCCWSVQFAGRRHLYNTGIGMENAFYIQLNLKGLSSIGKNFDDLLNNTEKY